MTRNQVRRLRWVFRRSILGINQRGPIPPLVLHAEGGQLRAHHRYRDRTVEHAEPGGYRPVMSLAIPLDDLADFEGSKDSAVVLEAAAPDRTVVRWEDRAIPQSREYDVTPVNRVGQVPERPATWASNPAELRTALAEATETSIPDSTRSARDLRANRSDAMVTNRRGRPRPARRVGEAGGDQHHQRHRATRHQPGRPDPGGRGPARDVRRRQVANRPPDLRLAATS